jgi:SAM-dependent methyltransferase
MEWFDDDTFWTTFSSYIYSDERLRTAPEDVDRVLALTGTSKPDVLDLCCGTGRHAAAFALRGCRVTGVDRTRFALDAARAHAAQEGVSVEFVESDMRDFVRPASFDLVVNLFTSFGYFDNPDDDRRVLRNIHESLRPGGAFVIELMGKEILAHIFQETRSALAPDGTLLIWRTQIADGWTRVKGEWYIVRDGIARGFQVDHSVYSGRELRDLLMQAGFAEVRLFGDLIGADYGLQASRLVAVARKAPVRAAVAGDRIT